MRKGFEEWNERGMGKGSSSGIGPHTRVIRGHWLATEHGKTDSNECLCLKRDRSMVITRLFSFDLIDLQGLFNPFDPMSMRSYLTITGFCRILLWPITVMFIVWL